MRIFPLAGVLGLLLGAVGCATVGKPPEFYLLAPEPGAILSYSGPALGLEPVDLPAYLDKAMLVTRHDEIRIETHGGHRWAEPLPQNVTRVLGRDLAQRLGLPRVYIAPRRAAPQVTRVARVELEQFLGAPGGQVILRGHWTVFPVNAPKRVLTEGSRRIALPAGPDHAALIRAMNTALGQLADAIAADLAAVKTAPSKASRLLD